ncbi:MAG: hypothetical protein HYX34_06575 [Actinobacteria bacterium]|nr:hypothetical protein [Actinomycetota bacterium]
MSAADPPRRAALNAAKLGALVREGWGAEARSGHVFPGGAALLGEDGTGWVLLDTGSERNLGGALTWARKVGAASLHVVVDDDAAAAVLARRATHLARPATRAWSVDGQALRPAEPAPIPRPLPPPEAPRLRALLAEVGLEVVEEDGIVVGELRGLEVARIEHDPDAEGGARLAVGVGRFDREVTAMLHGDLSTQDQLRRAVDIVGRYRRPGAAPHPMNQLVPERWMRAVLVGHPEVVGASDLRPVVSAVPRTNLRERLPATALGTAADTGEPLVVVCSLGVDVELVPTAADDRGFHAPDARLVLAVAARDVVPLTTALADQLVRPAQVVAVDGDWRTLP